MYDSGNRDKRQTTYEVAELKGSLVRASVNQLRNLTSGQGQEVC